MRKLFISVLCCTVLLLTVYAGYRGYKVWKQHHMLGLAREYMAKGDINNAVLSVSQALRSNPQNIEANRLMADFNEATGSRSALLWRSRVVELNPHSLDDHLAMARTAISFGEPAAASQSLDTVDADDKKTASYHNMCGALASATGQQSSAEYHFMEAARLEPTSPIPMLNLAVVHLHMTNNAAAQAEARTVLKNLSANPTNSNLRCLALRELISDGMRCKQTDLALMLSRQLLNETNSLFSDRLVRLQVLLTTKSSEYEPFLAAVQNEAAKTPGKIQDLSNWMLANASPAKTLTWLQSLPATHQTNQPVAILVADCLMAQKEWRKLQAILGKQNWGELDFVRHAFLARAFRGDNLLGASKAEWDQALKMANSQKHSLGMLLRMAAQWKWNAESEEILWAIVKKYPTENWAVQALTQSLAENGQTRLLMNLYTQQSKAFPANLGFKNNVAMLALLLNARELNPFELAHEIYQKAPTNTTFASTYAFSLYIQKKNAEALKVFETFKPQDLENPTLSGYYGLVLHATGNRARAKPYLETAIKGKLLPEERKLIDAARQGS